MNRLNRRRFGLALGGLGLVRAAGQAKAQADWPVRPVRLVVPYPAGGPTDTAARLIAQELSQLWRQAVVADNRAGANGNVGAAFAAKAPADGYTLLIGTSSSHGTNPALYANPGFDAVRDFDPVIQLTESTLFLGVPSQLPINSVRDLVAYAQAHPGKLNYGSIGNGSAHHLAGELLMLRTGIDIVHVPYKGSAAALAGLLAGEIQILFDSTMMQLAKGGQVRVLAVTTRERWPTHPQVPTVAEGGVADYALGGWFAIFAPKGTPAPVRARIGLDANSVLARPDIRQRYLDMGVLPVGGSAEQLARLVQSELIKGRELVKASKATPDN